MKKFGGTIKNWQVHTLSFTKEQIDRVYPGKNAKPLVITGTVVEDPIGRWKPGFHMKTSLIVKLDRKEGTVETLKTIYKLTGKENNDIFPNLGNAVANIFY